MILPTLVVYIVRTVMADSNIGEAEVNFVYQFGQDLDLSIKEISNIFADMFQMAYIIRASLLSPSIFPIIG